MQKTLYRGSRPFTSVCPGTCRLRVLACAVFDSEVLLQFLSSLPMGGNGMARQREGCLLIGGKWESAAFSALHLLLLVPDPMENSSVFKLVQRVLVQEIAQG